MPAKKKITQNMILKAALEILKEQGYEAITIKQLAGKLNCSTQPVYLSFSGMDALREQLVPLAVGEFEHYMKNGKEDGLVRLYDRRYIDFAKEEHNLFCFLFMRANAFSEIKRIILPMIEQSIEEFMDTYHISHEEADLLHDHLWMHAHGIASMIATKFCDWDMEKVQQMRETSKDMFTKKYEVRHVYQ